MAIKDELFSSAIDSLGNYLHSALDIFLSNIVAKEERKLQTKAELLELGPPNEDTFESTSNDLSQEGESPIQLPLLFMNRKIVRCPDCGNYDERYLYNEADDMTCLKCKCVFPIKCVDRSGDVPLLLVNGHPVSCPRCLTKNADCFTEEKTVLTCLECNQSFPIQNTLIEEGLLLFY